MADGIRDGKGNILKNTDPLFTKLSENYPPNNYTSFCNEFGVSFSQSQQLKIENLGYLHEALKQVLNRWLVNGKEVTREKLELALENAQTGGLIYIVKEHFSKFAEKEVPNEDDAGKKKTLSGATSIHNTVLINNITGQAAGSKRSVDEPDGHSVNKMKTNENLPRKMSIPMTDSHRKIIQKSTPALLRDLDADDITPDLLARGIMKAQHVDKINSKATRQKKVEELLDILPRSGDDAYKVFLDTLEKTALHLHTVVKSFEGQNSSETEAAISQATAPAGSLNTVDQPSRTGNTFSQTINASGDSNVIGTSMIGQINNRLSL